ncbi:MAG: hypothetical protein AAFV71_11415 [Cyanobacteria bacterium J06633_8]
MTKPRPNFRPNERYAGLLQASVVKVSGDFYREYGSGLRKSYVYYQANLYIRRIFVYPYLQSQINNR